MRTHRTLRSTSQNMDSRNMKAKHLKKHTSHRSEGMPNRKLGANIKKHRLELGMGLRDFAAAAGTDYTMVLRLERGHDIRLSSFLKLARTHGFQFEF